jgi:hypothetical protein
MLSVYDIQVFDKVKILKVIFYWLINFRFNFIQIPINTQDYL